MNGKAILDNLHNFSLKILMKESVENNVNMQGSTLNTIFIHIFVYTGNSSDNLARTHNITQCDSTHN